MLVYQRVNHRFQVVRVIFYDQNTRFWGVFGVMLSWKSKMECVIKWHSFSTSSNLLCKCLCLLHRHFVQRISTSPVLMQALNQLSKLLESFSEALESFGHKAWIRTRFFVCLFVCLFVCTNVDHRRTGPPIKCIQFFLSDVLMFNEHMT